MALYGAPLGPKGWFKGMSRKQRNVRWTWAGVCALLTAAGVSLALVIRGAGAVGPFSPQVNVSLWDPNPSAPSSIIITTWVTADPALGTWSLDMPIGWGVTSGSSVPIGDVVAEATMSVDVDCNGTVDEFGPFPLANQPIDPTAVADWTGNITSWWPLTVSVDGDAQQGYDLSADLTTITQPHIFCAPQVLAITTFGRSSPGNVQLVTNPGTAGNYTLTVASVSRGGAYATQTSDVVGVASTPMPTTDIDGDGVISERPCDSDPADPSRRPERTDGPFAGTDDNGNGLVDEMLPPGAESFDCDGDGYSGAAEAHVFGVARAGQDACGTTAWPSDFISGGIPNSTDRVTVTDLTSFIGPVRRLNTSPGDPGFDVRWDVLPGAGILPKAINVSDLTSLFSGTSGSPPMLGGAAAFNGPVCPWGSAPGPTPTPGPSATPTASPAPRPTPTPTPSATPTPTPTLTPPPTPTLTPSLTPTPVPTPTPSPPPNGDIDGDGVIDETACGSDPNIAASRPERLDGAFAGTDDDLDGLIDEALPAGAASHDCDGDGFTGNAEDNVFGAGTLRDQDPCGVSAWPADFISGGIPNSTNRLTVTDLTSFLAPARHLNTSPGDSGFDVRWDLTPGKGLFTTVINVNDLTSLLAGPTGNPPMLLGARALNGPSCPWPQ